MLYRWLYHLTLHKVRADVDERVAIRGITSSHLHLGRTVPLSRLLSISSARPAPLHKSKVGHGFRHHHLRHVVEWLLDLCPPKPSPSDPGDEVLLRLALPPKLHLHPFGTLSIPYPNSALNNQPVSIAPFLRLTYPIRRLVSPVIPPTHEVPLSGSMPMKISELSRTGKASSMRPKTGPGG